MDFELNLAPVYAANLSTGAWGLLGWCLHQLHEKGYVGGVEPSNELQELLGAGLVRKYGKSVKVSPEVAKPMAEGSTGE